MKSLFNYIISTESRYNNKKEVGDKELILNTEVTERDYMFVNRIGKVLSGSFLKENEYFVAPDQIFAYKRKDNWHCPDEYCFVEPISSDNKWSPYGEENLKGKLVYSNEELNAIGLSIGDVIGFTPDSEYEFEIEGKKLYRILSNQVTINYGQKKKSNSRS